MNEWLSRTALLIGDENIDVLKQKHVLIVGLGGVGAYSAEMIARAGVGKLTIVDGDVVQPSNRNRQLIALLSTQGRSKAELMAERLNDINPDLDVTAVSRYIRDEEMLELLKQPFDYVVDAIDTLSPKMYLIYHCVQNKLPIVSSMGSGGKLDLSKSHNCKLAHVLRKRLRKLGVSKGVKVVYSVELVSKQTVITTEDELNKKSIVGTISYMPAIFGCFLASVVIRDLLENAEKKA